MKKQVCAIYGVPKEHHSYMKKALRVCTVRIYAEPLSEKNKDPQTNILVVFVDSPISKKIIHSLPTLAYISTMSTGYDHIDLDTAREKNISVSNVPTYGENTVAEHALALILALSRKLFPSIERVKSGIYDYHNLQGFDLAGKTIGVLGTGHIGMHLIRMLQGFDATVIAHDPYPKKEYQKTYGFTYATFDRVVRTADILSLHVPLLPSTYHMIHRTVLKKMKKGSYIINTARGGLIDAKALLSALNTGRLAGAGLDTLEGEEDLPHYSEGKERHTHKKQSPLVHTNKQLMNHPLTIVTPHNAFNSAESMARILDTTIQNILCYTRGTIQYDVTKK